MTLQEFWAKVNLDASDLWEKDKLFFILFGVVILIVKFRSLLVDLIVSDSANVLKNAEKDDSALAKDEKANNQAADQLVQHAQQLSSQEGKVTDDWNKK